MQALDERLIVCQLVHRNIEHRQDAARIIVRVHVNIWAREIVVLQRLLNIRIELCHERVEVRHLLRVVHRRRRPGLV